MSSTTAAQPETWGGYNSWHDAVLKIIADTVEKHLPPSHKLTVDLKQYNFPNYITPTDLRPDIVLWWGITVWSQTGHLFIWTTCPLRHHTGQKRGVQGGTTHCHGIYLGLQSATLVDLTGCYMYIIQVRAQTRKSHKIPRLGWCKGRQVSSWRRSHSKLEAKVSWIYRGSWLSYQFWPELHCRHNRNSPYTICRKAIIRSHKI